MEIRILDEVVDLLWQKALFWRRQKLLILADLHLGKVNHFRKAGIPVPLKANQKNQELLISLIMEVKPDRVVFLGDLFHSHYNSEWETVKQLVDHFRFISFELVRGNHDILNNERYRLTGLKLHEEKLDVNPFIFTHEPVPQVPADRYTLSGHIHPGIQLIGKGKQAVVLPCFCFSDQQGYLPAFGAFTGMARIHPKKTDRIYAVANDRIMKV